MRSNQRHPEPAQEERTFSVAKWTVIGREAVHGAVLAQFRSHGVQCCDRAGILGRQGAADRGQQQRRVGTGRGRAALPAAAMVDAAAGGFGEQGVGEAGQLGRAAAGAVPGEGAQVRDTGGARAGAPVVGGFPDSGFRLVPAPRDQVEAEVGGAFGVRGEVVVAGHRREQLPRVSLGWALLALAARSPPRTLRQLEWTNATLEILSPQVLAS
ncbi:hypothetical protein [Amycolatopsis sp. NPDC049159]|uniref:hypothetical protein n=1 Tax=Amycolatopsis sp. NPDC049159 TaxID=3157210 RepID=UPI0033E42791